MIRQSRRQRRRPLPVTPRGHLFPQRPHAPTEVIPHHHQPRASLMKAQLFGKRVRLAFLPPAELPLRPKPTLHEAGVDRLRPLRLLQRFLRLFLTSPHHLAGHSHHTATRQVMIYANRPSALPGVIQLGGPQGSLSSGGWQCQVNTVNSQFTLYSPDALPIGTYQPMVLLVETAWELSPGIWLNRTLGPNGQFNPGYPYADARILLDGYVQQGSVHQDVDKDTLSFTCVGPQQILNDAQAHLVGYYNTTYTSVTNGIPAGCKPSAMGQGYLVGGLITADLYHSILAYHSNIATYHDVHIWSAIIPTQPYQPTSKTPYYTQVYSTLSMNEGSIWQNLSDLATNEFGQVYCERDGSIRIGPQINMRGGDVWNTPTLLGTTSASTLINLVQHLGYSLPPDLASLPGALSTPLPALPMPLTFVHPWGAAASPTGVGQPWSGAVDQAVLAGLLGLTGPPILCVFSDSPVYDGAAAPPARATPWGLLPGTLNNWPQDLAVYPTSIDVQENYTGRTSLVKLIGTLALSQSIMTSWYPQNAFSITKDGTSTIVTTTLPVGNWIVDQSHLLPDMTTKLNKNLVVAYWWEMAARTYWMQNVYYNATVSLGMCTFLSLGDIVALNRQNNVLGSHWANKPFYVTDLSLQLDMTNRTWVTTVSLMEVTSAAMGPVIAPPKVIPKG